MEVYIGKSMDNQVYKLVVLTGETVTRGMLVIPEEKQNEDIR